MKKIFSIFLLISILASIVSCGTETVNDPVQSGSQDTTTAVTETEAISSDLPDVTYDGYEFKFLSSDEVGSVRYSSELFAESENGEPVNDAVYKRNRMVEERFDVKISKIEQNKSDVVNSFKNSVLAGDNEYDVLVHQMDSVLTMAYLYGAPVSELKYVDIDKPWWDGDIIRQTAVKGKAFTLTGDINLVDNKATWCLLFNKRLADEYIDGDLYETVRSGKWTLQKLAECCKLASHDLNGDGAMDYQDQWGMLASGNVAASFIWSCGGGFGRTDKNGDIELTIDSERNINALEKTYELFADRDSVIDINRIPNGENGLTNWDYQRKMFNDGRALFIGGLAQYVEYYREMEDEFGILPLPKYDEDQSDYICTAQEWCATMLLVPKTAPDFDRTSVLLEALASASVSTITPAYYDVTLQRKHTRDDESKEMLDIIFNSRIFDVVYAYNWGGVRSIANNLTSDSNTIASSIASLKTASATAPVVIGHEILGRIDEINGETELRPGDLVTVDPLISCGVCPACRRGDRHVCRSLKLLGIHENGGYAEFTKASLDKIVKIPEGLSEKLAALSEPFAVGAHVTARSGMKKGDRVLVIGGGPIGIIVALCAKECGAAVHISEPNEIRRELAEKLGIDCLDPFDAGFNEKLGRIIGDDGFDVVIEASGSKPGILMTTEVCRIGGVIVPMALAGNPVEFILGRVSFKEQTVVGSRVYTHEHFCEGVKLLADISGKLELDPLVSDILPLYEANLAIEMMKNGTNAGKILIDCENK